MGNKTILQKVFDALQLSIDADVNCELTPRQCRELLDRDDRLVKAIDHYTDKVVMMNEEIIRLRRMLELERSNE